MTAKEYLNRVRRQYYVVKQAEEELTAIKADILSLKASSMTEHVSGTKESDLADKYIKLEKYFDAVIAEWDKLIDMRIEVKAIISKIPNESQQAVLYARYINCKRWEVIASEMGYSWQGIFKLHGKALQAFESVDGSRLLTGV